MGEDRGSAMYGPAGRRRRSRDACGTDETRRPAGDAPCFDRPEEFRWEPRRLPPVFSPADRQVLAQQRRAIGEGIGCSWHWWLCCCATITSCFRAAVCVVVTRGLHRNFSVLAC